MKRLLSILLLVSSSTFLVAQQKSYDTAALIILDRMSDVIGDLSSCSFRLMSSTDHVDTAAGMQTSYALNDVFMVGPNKMLINVEGNKGHRAYFYNGATLSYYSFDENNYATINAPPNIMDAIDSVHDAYGIDFPAADFFFPGFTDDMLEQSDEISFMGKVMLEGKECFHIVAKSKEMTMQFWISTNALMLPEKFVITYNRSKEVARYEGSFEDWKLNPDLPLTMFEFTPPPSASAVYLFPKSIK